LAASGLVQTGNFEGEKDFVGFLDAAPETGEPKTGVEMRCLMRGKYGLPSREVRNSITTKHVGH
jgi:hypothetical protein